MRRTTLFWLDDVRRDVSYAARVLARNPGFATAAVITLALGIGATTAVFSVVNAVLLRPLPYPDSDRLVRIVERLPARNANTPPGRRTAMTWTEFSEWRARTTTLSAMAYALTPLVVWVATRCGVLSHPGGRHIHRSPVPRLGGIAVYLAFVAAVLAGLPLEHSVKVTVEAHRVVLSLPFTPELDRPVIGVLCGATHITKFDAFSSSVTLNHGHLGVVKPVGVGVAAVWKCTDNKGNELMRRAFSNKVLYSCPTNGQPLAIQVGSQQIVFKPNTVAEVSVFNLPPKSPCPAPCTPNMHHFSAFLAVVDSKFPPSIDLDHMVVPAGSELGADYCPGGRI